MPYLQLGLQVCPLAVALAQGALQLLAPLLGCQASGARSLQHLQLSQAGGALSHPVLLARLQFPAALHHAAVCKVACTPHVPS